ncbi:MAG: shikimate dehydrogenase [Parvularculaceae bacterium]
MGLFNSISKSFGKPKTVRRLFDKGLLTLAEQPKDSAFDIRSPGVRRLFLFPIDHDYPGGSAAMHNAVFARFGLPYRASFVIGDPANVGAIFAALRQDPLYGGGGAGSGFKDKVAPHLDRLDKSAQAIGSVNVIAREEDGLVGYNTDGVGFVLGLLNEYPNCIEGRKIVILGAGGTALPIAYEMAQRNPSEIVIVNRTVSKAEKIAELIAPFTHASALGEDRLGDALEGAGVVVNTSNKGAQPNEQFSAFAAMTGDVEGDMAKGEANLARLPKDAIVADILLEPETTTLRMAAANGNPTHSGRFMNLFQAVPAFRIMTGMTDDNLQKIMSAALG